MAPKALKSPALTVVKGGIKGGKTLPPNAARHVERHKAAARSLRKPAAFQAPTPVLEQDGRVAFPGVVEYRLNDGTTVATPPADNGIVYQPVIHDLALYDWMRARGLTETGHRVV